jgi:hypothetical protein
MQRIFSVTVSGPWADRERTVSGPWVDREWTVSEPWVNRERTVSGPWADRERTVSGSWVNSERALSVPIVWFGPWKSFIYKSSTVLDLPMNILRIYEFKSRSGPAGCSRFPVLRQYKHVTCTLSWWGFRKNLQPRKPEPRNTYIILF